MILGAFREVFPELHTAGDALVQAMLDRAERSIDSSVFGERFDDAHGLLAAHLLVLSPYGKNARLQSATGTSPYWPQYDAIRIEVTCGLSRVF